MRRLRNLLLAFAAFAACTVCGAAELRVGATTTLEDSGVLAVLLPAFSAATGVKVRPIIAGTGQVLKYADNGDVDVVFTHSRVDEEKLVERGVGKARTDVMWNEFVIAGPAGDPARIRGEPNAAMAFRRIQATGARFASRGDDSGTHKCELVLWAAAGGLRPWPGYLSTGQGAGRTLMIAHELGAYDLVDRATLKQFAKRFPMQALVEGDPRLLNNYAVTTLRPAPGRPVSERDADAFAAWMVSEPARKLIASYRVEGERVFYLPGEPKSGNP